MNDNNKADRRRDAGTSGETPVKTQDWDRFGGDEVKLDIGDDEILAHVEEVEEEEAEEAVDNDDNPYQESDQALPDDEEEAAISRHPSREGSRFDEI